MIATYYWKRVLSSKRVWFGILVMLTLGFVAVLAPWVAPHDPYKASITQSNLPPAWVHGAHVSGMAEYILGTDRYGRDILSRLIYGTRTAVILALTAVPLAALIGSVTGLVSGYMGGRLDTILMNITDVISSLPGMMFTVVIVLIFRNILSPTWLHGEVTLIVGFAAVSWVGLTRLVRVDVLRLKSQLFVEAAIALGSSPWQVITNHLLPNILHVILVWIINNIPAVILLEAVLGYFGVGVTSAIDGGEFTIVSWGGMFFSGRSAMSSNPFMLLIPSLCILLISMSFIYMADFLNEVTQKG